MNMWTDIAANQNVHDIIAHIQMAFVEPSAHVEYAVHLQGFFQWQR